MKFKAGYIMFPRSLLPETDLIYFSMAGAIILVESKNANSHFSM